MCIRDSNHKRTGNTAHLSEERSWSHCCRHTMWEKWETWNFQPSGNRHGHQRIHRHRHRGSGTEGHASNGSQLLGVSRDGNVKTNDTKPFWKKMAMALTKSTSEFYEFTRRNGVKQTLIAPNLGGQVSDKQSQDKQTSRDKHSSGSKLPTRAKMSWWYRYKAEQRCLQESSGQHKHKSNDVQIAAQMLAKPCREVLIINKLSLTSTDFTYTITSNPLCSNHYHRAKWQGRPKNDTTAQATTNQKPTKVRSKKNNRVDTLFGAICWRSLPNGDVKFSYLRFWRQGEPEAVNLSYSAFTWKSLYSVFQHGIIAKQLT